MREPFGEQFQDQVSHAVLDGPRRTDRGGRRDPHDGGPGTADPAPRARQPTAPGAVEYRTTRQRATYHDGVADIRAAITHLADHADEFAIDAGRIGIWGESAGGYLASLVGLTDPRIRAVVDQFGASDLSHVADGFDPRMRDAMSDPGNPIHRYGAIDADPADLAHPAAPPFLLPHGDDDRIIAPAQTERLHRALLAAGADSTRYLLAGAGHGSLSLTRRQAEQWTFVQVLSTIRDFLDRHLRS